MLRKLFEPPSAMQALLVGTVIILHHSTKGKVDLSRLNLKTNHYYCFQHYGRLEACSSVASHAKVGSRALDVTYRITPNEFPPSFSCLT